jgi:hypothetical protein
MNPLHQSSSTGLGWVHIKGGGIGVGGWGKEKARDEACGGEARGSLVDHVNDSVRR